MVFRGLVGHHARSLSHFGATVAGIESITQDARREQSCEVRGSHPNEEIHDEGTIKGRSRYPCHGLLIVGTRFTRGVLRVRLLMNNGTWPYSLSRRRIKRSRKKAFKGRIIERHYKCSLFIRLMIVVSELMKF